MKRRVGLIDPTKYEQWKSGHVQETTDEEPDLSRPWFESTPVKSTITTTNEEFENMLSFDEVLQLIEAGKPIPGEREIPDILNSETPSISSIPLRKKPWEIQSEAQA